MGPCKMNPAQCQSPAQRLQQTQRSQQGEAASHANPTQQQQKPPGLSFGSQQNSLKSTGAQRADDNVDLLKLLASLLMQKTQNTQACAMMTPEQMGQNRLNVMG